MSFKKPFRAVPLKLGDRYRRKQRNSDRKTASKFLSLAAILGATLGATTVALRSDGRAGIASVLKPIAVRTGLVRPREPQPGDYWGGCDDARAAETAPIYSGEPGYHENMDGDNDGIACERHQ